MLWDYKQHNADPLLIVAVLGFKLAASILVNEGMMR